MKLLLRFATAAALAGFLFYLMGDKMPAGMFAMLALIPIALYFAPKRDVPGHLVLTKVTALKPSCWKWQQKKPVKNN